LGQFAQFSFASQTLLPHAVAPPPAPPSPLLVLDALVVEPDDDVDVDGPLVEPPSPPEPPLPLSLPPLPDAELVVSVWALPSAHAATAAQRTNDPRRRWWRAGW